MSRSTDMLRVAAAAACCLVAGPAGVTQAAPPRPIVASHDVAVKAKRGDAPRTTRAIPVHVGGVIGVDMRQPVRRLRLKLDCPYRKLRSVGRRWWTFEIRGAGCTAGSLRARRRGRVTKHRFSLVDHAHARAHCERAESHVVTENELVRVYSFWSGDDDEPNYAENEFFACRLDSGEERLIGRDHCGDAYYGCDFLDYPTLAGEHVAYVTGHYNGRYGPDRRSTLTVLDTSTWRTERAIEEREDPIRPERRGFTALALKANGAVAWILDRTDYTAAGPPYYEQTFEVHKADSTGSGLLDSSPDIYPWSLTLSGSVLQWELKDGETRSATLD